VPLATPDLDVVYTAPASVSETGVGRPLPERKPFALS
jgi:hypothetical protein